VQNDITLLDGWHNIDKADQLTYSKYLMLKNQ
jgi:hypothetical protein